MLHGIKYHKQLEKDWFYFSSVNKGAAKFDKGHLHLAVKNTRFLYVQSKFWNWLSLFVKEVYGFLLEGVGKTLEMI